MIKLLACSLQGQPKTPPTEGSRSTRIPVWILDYIMGLSPTWMGNEQRAPLASQSHDRASLDL